MTRTPDVAPVTPSTAIATAVATPEATPATASPTASADLSTATPILTPPPATYPPCYGIDAASGAAANTAFLTWSHTVSDGLNRVILVGVSHSGANFSALSITYGGLQLSPIAATSDSTSAPRVEMWYLKQPKTGTANVVVTMSGTVPVVGGAISVSGVDQSAWGATATSSGNSSTASVTVPSAPGELVVDTVALLDSVAVIATLAAPDAGVNQAGGPPTAGAGQAQRWVSATKSSIHHLFGAGSTEAGANPVTMSWTLDQARPWAIGAVALLPKCDAPTPTSTPALPPSSTPLSTIAVPTLTLVPTFTPLPTIDVPTLTLVPTFTPLPTIDVPTLTLVPTFTPLPTIDVPTSALLSSGVAGAGSNEAGNNTVTMSWSLGGDHRWGLGAVS